MSGQLWDASIGQLLALFKPSLAKFYFEGLTKPIDQQCILSGGRWVDGGGGGSGCGIFWDDHLHSYSWIL